MPVYAKRDTLVEKCRLHRLKDDIRLGRVGVETFVFGGIVVLEHDYRVLSLGYLEVLGILGSTQHVGCSSLDGFAIFVLFRHRVGVNRNEQITIVAVSYLCSLFQSYKNVGLAGVFYGNVGHIVFYQLAQFQYNTEVYVFLFTFHTYGTSIVASMTGIEHNYKLVFSCSLCYNHCWQHNGSYDETYL